MDVHPESAVHQLCDDRVHGDGAAEVDQAGPHARPGGRGVGAGDDVREQAPRQQEVRVQQPVPGGPGGDGVVERGEVQHYEAAGGQQQGGRRMGQQPAGTAVHDGAQPPRAADGQGPQQQGDRGPQHQGERGVHADEHVLDHVAPEVGVGEGRDGRQERRGRQDDPGGEARRTPPAPARDRVAAARPPGQVQIHEQGEGRQQHAGQPREVRAVVRHAVIHHAGVHHAVIRHAGVHRAWSVMRGSGRGRRTARCARAGNPRRAAARQGRGNRCPTRAGGDRRGRDGWPGCGGPGRLRRG